MEGVDEIEVLGSLDFSCQAKIGSEVNGVPTDMRNPLSLLGCDPNNTSRDPTKSGRLLDLLTY